MNKKNNRTNNSSSKKKNSSKLVLSLCTAIVIISGGGTLIHKASQSPTNTPENTPVNTSVQTTIHKSTVTESQQASSQYTTKDAVARYICDNDRLPPNYVNKEEAMRLYEEKTGKKFERWNFNPQRKLGIMIGGDSFSNREQKLPQGSYKEADVDYFEVNRGKNRLIYTKNCNIYHTSDHYQTFTKLNIQKNQ
jgi:guanyl-specific ribonuclease Sa